MANLTYISPFFIVTHLQTSLSFYTDKLGFEIRFIGPEGDPYFAIVGRDKISIFLKEIIPGINPIPNSTRHEWARWDAFIYAEDPDALFEEYQSAGITFRRPVTDDDDGLRGFELADADGYVLFFGRVLSKN
jgi:catechol 2,3-dioxygenase-like lactoylglutathione lyase family enzyme